MNVIDIISKFNIVGSVTDYTPIGNGHINTTFLIKTNCEKSYVLQKINNNVFKNVDGLMNNIYQVTEYLRNNGFETLELIKTKDGGVYYQVGNEYYRVLVFIDNAICYEGVTDLQQVYNAGKAFGLLHKALRGFDASLLYEVIPNFHNTKQRYNNLLVSIKSDQVNRVKDCKTEIDNLLRYEKQYSIIVDALANKEISFVVTHNDPKINNVLFDKTSGDIRAVIDLDTIMPGSYLYDFGDALRSLFTGEYEDSKDLSKISVNTQIFEKYTAGYLSEMKDVLNEKEISLLAFSTFLLTIESAIRFLTDYLNGDTYFKTDYSEHNLIRARTQLKLANEIFNRLPELNKIVQECLTKK